MEKKTSLYLIMTGIATIFIMIFSMSTSPLYENGYMAWDSDIFLSMGKFTKEGLIPYVDFFDHKGPFIILVQCLGYLLGGKTGVFVIQIVFMTLSLVGTYRICRLYCGNKPSYIISISSLLVLNMYYDNGNLTEEYCLTFLIWSIYLTIKQGRLKWKNIRLDYVLYGITFMIGAMSRLTNSLPIAAIVIVLTVTTVKAKQWKKLIVDLMWFIVGNLLILIPILTYFIKVDALTEMLNATFIYNFKHGFERNIMDTGQIINMVALTIPLIIVLTVGIWAVKNKDLSKEGWILTLSAVIALILMKISRPYPHYIMIWMPVIVLAMALLMSRLKDKSIRWYGMCGLLMAVVAVKLVTTGLDTYKGLTSNIGALYDKECRDIVSEINEEDKVIAYNIYSRFYLTTDILPCYKNFAFQGIHTSVDKKEQQDFERDLASFEAKYIITGNRDGVYSKWIEENYKLEKSTKIFRLYARE